MVNRKDVERLRAEVEELTKASRGCEKCRPARRAHGFYIGVMGRDGPYSVPGSGPRCFDRNGCRTCGEPLHGYVTLITNDEGPDGRPAWS